MRKPQPILVEHDEKTEEKTEEFSDASLFKFTDAQQQSKHPSLPLPAHTQPHFDFEEKGIDQRVCKSKQSAEASISWLCAFWCFMGFCFLIVSGHLEEFIHRYILRTAVFQTEKVRPLPPYRLVRTLSYPFCSISHHWSSPRNISTLGGCLGVLETVGIDQ